jgi:hypothetical protein
VMLSDLNKAENQKKLPEIFHWVQEKIIPLPPKILRDISGLYQLHDEKIDANICELVKNKRYDEAEEYVQNQLFLRCPNAREILADALSKVDQPLRALTIYESIPPDDCIISLKEDELHTNSVKGKIKQEADKLYESTDKHDLEKRLEYALKGGNQKNIDLVLNQMIFEKEFKEGEKLPIKNVGCNVQTLLALGDLIYRLNLEVKIEEKQKVATQLLTGIISTSPPTSPLTKPELENTSPQLK